MATIRCSASGDGGLTPYTVEFEPGDLIQLDPADRGSTVAVETAFTLADVSVYLDQLMVKLSVAGGCATPVHNERPDPKLPPPPPEQGAILRVPGATVIKFVVDKRS